MENTKPSVFEKTIYRLPNNSELKEIDEFKLSSDQILEGLKYTIIGRGITDSNNKQTIIEAITQLCELFPKNVEYQDALTKAKKIQPKFMTKPISENSKPLIKRLLHENLEEGPITRAVGTAAMALGTALAPTNMQAKNSNKAPTELTNNGKVIKKGEYYISTARGIAPVAEISRKLALTNAQDQILAKLGMENGSFRNVVVTNEKTIKNKNGTFTTTVTISTILN